MKSIILFVIAFILLSIAIDVSAIRSVIAPNKTLIESAAENLLESITTKEADR